MEAYRISILLILSSVVISSRAFALPAGNSDFFGRDRQSSDTEVLARTPLRKQHPVFALRPVGYSSFTEDDDDFTDDGFDSLHPLSYPHFRNPLGGAFKEMEETMRRLQDEMRRLANQTDNGSSVFIDGDIDPSTLQNKTTSKTVEINGHTVQINETTYSSGDKNNSRFFHFKTVHVLPKDASKTEQQPPTVNPQKPTTDDVEIPSSFGNNADAVGNNNSNGAEQIENHDIGKEEMDNEIANRRSIKDDDVVQLDISNRIDDVTDNSRLKYNLASDTLVNDYYARQNVGPQGLIKIDPDAELINVR